MAIDYEKVVKGLKCCERDVKLCYGETVCEYYSLTPRCWTSLAHDALALIRQQQERIKELEAGRFDRDNNVLGKWISVKDRLPRSMANKVLVYVQHEDLVGYIGFGHYEKFHGEEMWYDLERGEQFARNGYIVTHWMPLPERPKEENE